MSKLIFKFVLILLTFANAISGQDANECRIWKNAIPLTWEQLQGDWYITAAVNGSDPGIRAMGTCLKMSIIYNPGNGTTSLDGTYVSNGSLQIFDETFLGRNVDSLVEDNMVNKYQALVFTKNDFYVYALCQKTNGIKILDTVFVLFARRNINQKTIFKTLKLAGIRFEDIHDYYKNPQENCPN